MLAICCAMVIGYFWHDCYWLVWHHVILAIYGTIWLRHFWQAVILTICEWINCKLIGLWLRAQGSGLMAHGSWLMAHACMALARAGALGAGGGGAALDECIFMSFSLFFGWRQARNLPTETSCERSWLTGQILEHASSAVEHSIISSHNSWKMKYTYFFFSLSLYISLYIYTYA